MGSDRKLSDKEFLEILRKNAGLYSRTARKIRIEFGIEYSRQAVRQRAENFPEELSDIKEENLDLAEEGLNDLMKLSTNEAVRLRAIELYLKTIGRSRGYIEKSEFHLSGSIEIKKPSWFDDRPINELHILLPKQTVEETTDN